MHEGTSKEKKMEKRIAITGEKKKKKKKGAGRGMKTESGGTGTDRRELRVREPRRKEELWGKKAFREPGNKKGKLGVIKHWWGDAHDARGEKGLTRSIHHQPLSSIIAETPGPRRYPWRIIDEIGRERTGSLARTQHGKG